jgi:hypothetical protein
MSMKRKIRTIGGMLLATLGLSAATASPAYGSYPCNDGYSCYWDTEGYPGAHDAVWVAPTCEWHDLTGIGWANRIATIPNRGGGSVGLYDDEQGLQLLGVIGVGAEVNLSGTSANNRADKVYIAC